MTIQMRPLGTEKVAPLAGAWIEILQLFALCLFELVAPLAGAWIEITNRLTLPGIRKTSLPSRERGLKFENESISFDDLQSRSPRGSVD